MSAEDTPVRGDGPVGTAAPVPSTDPAGTTAPVRTTADSAERAPATGSAAPVRRRDLRNSDRRASIPAPRLFRRSRAPQVRLDVPAVAETPGDEAIAWARDLVKVYGSGPTAVRALDSVDVDFGRAEMTAIMGPSGSGKSTLMHCMAGLDSVTSGTVTVDGEVVSKMRERALTTLRRTRLGFVFQAFNLVPTLTAEENITLPQDIARVPVDREHFDSVVDAVGLRDRLSHRPGELSGGQQQRVACARALVARPAVVFADEPTGNLDSRSSAEVLGFLRNSVDELGQSVVMVTHDPTAASYAHRVLFLADGRLVGELRSPTPAKILAALAELTDASPARRAGEAGTAGKPGKAGTAGKAGKPGKAGEAGEAGKLGMAGKAAARGTTDPASSAPTDGAPRSNKAGDAGTDA